MAWGRGEGMDQWRWNVRCLLVVFFFLESNARSLPICFLDGVV